MSDAAREAAAADVQPAGEVPEAAAAAPEAAARPLGPDGKPLSKKAMKRLQRKQKWLEARPAMRKAERERRKARRKAQREERERLEAAGQEVPEELRPKKTNKRSREEMLKLREEATLRLAVDVDFDRLHSLDRDYGSLMGQLRNSYAAVRRAEKPARLSIVGLSDQFRERLAVSCPEFERWAVDFERRPFDQAYSLDEVVYLSADAKDVVREFDPSKVYVIGGIVDHNNHKGLTQEMCEKRGVATAQLPIGEYMKGAGRKVLTVNHVVELVQRVHDTGSWLGSLEAVLPRRKGLQPVAAEAGQVPSAATGEPPAKRARTEAPAAEEPKKE